MKKATRYRLIKTKPEPQRSRKTRTFIPASDLTPPEVWSIFDVVAWKVFTEAKNYGGKRGLDPKKLALLGLAKRQRENPRKRSPTWRPEDNADLVAKKTRSGT